VTEDYVGVAITRIQEIDRQKGVILDEQFLPACLEIQIIPGLCKRFAEFLALLRVCGDILAERMNNDTMSDIVKTLNLMQLQEINRSEAGLTLRFDQPHLHPYILFGSLIELAASLATFTEPERRLQEEFQYHHKDPIKTFEPLFEKATQILNIIMEGGHNN
jgi:type VI secretion system protein ImpJ